MKLLLSLMLIFSVVPSAIAVGSVTEFRCVTDRGLYGSNPRFVFRVVNLARGRMDYAFIDARAENEDAVVREVTRERTSIATLNDNRTIQRISDGFQMVGDGDGCEWVTLRMYKNSGYRRGFLRVKDGGCGSSGDAYVTVSCNVITIR